MTPEELAEMLQYLMERDQALQGVTDQPMAASPVTQIASPMTQLPPDAGMFAPMQMAEPPVMAPVEAYSAQIQPAMAEPVMTAPVESYSEPVFAAPTYQPEPPVYQPPAYQEPIFTPPQEPPAYSGPKLPFSSAFDPSLLLAPGQTLTPPPPPDIIAPLPEPPQPPPPPPPAPPPPVSPFVGIPVMPTLPPELFISPPPPPPPPPFVPPPPYVGGAPPFNPVFNPPGLIDDNEPPPYTGPTKPGTTPLPVELSPIDQGPVDSPTPPIDVYTPPPNTPTPTLPAFFVGPSYNPPSNSPAPSTYMPTDGTSSNMMLAQALQQERKRRRTPRTVREALMGQSDLYDWLG